MSGPCGLRKGLERATDALRRRCRKRPGTVSDDTAGQSGRSRKVQGNTVFLSIRPGKPVIALCAFGERSDAMPRLEPPVDSPRPAHGPNLESHCKLSAPPRQTRERTSLSRHRLEDDRAPPTCPFSNRPRRATVSASVRVGGMVKPTRDYDLVCIGSGPAGQRAAVQAAKLGKRVAVVEKLRCVGGVCLGTGTIPSKTLREAVLLLSRIPGRHDPGRATPPGARPTVNQLLARVEEVLAREQDVIEDSAPPKRRGDGAWRSLLLRSAHADGPRGRGTTFCRRSSITQRWPSATRSPPSTPSTSCAPDGGAVNAQAGLLLS